MEVEIGKLYLAYFTHSREKFLFEVVGPVQKLGDLNDNEDRMLVRDLEYKLLDVEMDDMPEEDCAGGDLVFIYNIDDWTFEPVPKSYECTESAGEESVECLKGTQMAISINSQGSVTVFDDLRERCCEVNTLEDAVALVKAVKRCEDSINELADWG